MDIKIDKKKKVKSLLLIFFLSLFLRLIFVGSFIGFSADPATEPEPDAPQYEEIALNIIENGEYFQMMSDIRFNAYRPPLFPVFIGGVYKIFGKSRVILRTVSTIISSLLPCFVFLIAIYLLDYRIALLSGIYTAFYPFYIFYSGLYLTETLFLSLFYASILCSIYMVDKLEIKISILSAITLGLASLTRPVTYPLPFFIVIAMVLKHGLNKNVIKNFMIFLITFIIVVSPWFLRNYIIFHKLILGDAHGGQTFYGAYNPGLLKNRKFIGSWYMPPQSELPPKYRYNPRGDSELGQNRMYFKLGLMFIREYSSHLPYFVWRRFVRFFSFWPSGALYRKLISLFTYGFLIPFIVLGIYYLRKDWKKFIIIHLVIFELLMVSLIMVASVRMRNPLDGFFIIFAFVAITKIWDKLRGKKVEIIKQNK